MPLDRAWLDGLRVNRSALESNPNPSLTLSFAKPAMNQGDRTVHKTNVGWAITLLAGLLALQAVSAADLPPETAAASLHWRLVGPFRGGRTKAVTGVPGQPDTFLIGAVNGGVWKTTDSGRTWNPIFDAAPTQSIGAIAVAPSDPSVIYVGSGEGLIRPDLSVGDGIYRSSDAGVTWTHLALEDAQQIPDLAVDPHDANRVYAAVLGHPFGPSSQRGVFRSTDGGKTWSRVLHVDDDTGASFVRIDPQNAQVLYAGLWNVRAGPWEDNNDFNGTKGGLFKSTDGGEHWQRLANGLPDNLSQLDVVIAPSLPSRLYATIATSEEGDYQSAVGLGVYRSDDAGEHWYRVTTDPRPALRIGGGDLPLLKVDPQNPDVLYSASIVTQKSSDGGAHWTSLRGSPGGDDYQNLWVSPDDPRRIAMVSDQGAIITLNGGATWSSWLNQPTAQLYHIGVSADFPYRLCSGQQESGSVCISSRGNDGEITLREWHPVGAIEYGYVVPDPLDPGVVFGAGRNVVTKEYVATGQVQDVTPIPVKGADTRVDRTEPLLFAPTDPHRMYYTANRVYESLDRGRSWRVISPDLTRENPGVPSSVGVLYSAKAAKQRGAIYAASASPIADGTLWAGTDDGLVWVTVDDGQHWQNVTAPALTPWSKVTQIEASHFDAQTAYVSVSRFRIDDLKPYIYRTRDGGKTWSPIVTGLPQDEAVNAVREDSVRRGLLFAATEKAVWASFDDGDHWFSLQLNLPHTSMRDLAVHDQDLIVATHGRSFWILDDISPLRQFSTKLASGEATLLVPAPALRVRRSTGTDTPIQPDEPAGQNPPDGAVIDYYLDKDASRPVIIEVLDPNGSVVIRAASSDPPEYSAEQLERELIPRYWIRKLVHPAATRGMHRWVWDLHYTAPRSLQRGFPISAVPGDTPQEPLGPVAAPGHYQVRLSIGARQWHVPLAVLPDPRVNLSAADYAALFTTTHELAETFDASSAALLACQSLRAQLGQLQKKADGPLGEQIHRLDVHIGELLESPKDVQPARRGLERLNGDVAALYGQVNGVDAPPTAVALTEGARAGDDWHDLEARWRQVRDVEVPQTNLALAQASLPVLVPNTDPPRDLNFADEE
jgi:photosystem II stability/assembly factor-like uncharacterized protein